MKKLFLILICTTLLFSSTPFASAEPSHVVDHAGLLTNEEILQLESKAQTLVDTYNMDIVILTTWGMDGKSAQTFAEDFYDDNGYGIGSDDSGILLLIAMESREWFISTCGQAIYAFTDYGIDQLAGDILYDLSSGSYYYAFDTYLSLLPEYFKAYESGQPVDSYSYHEPDIYYPGNSEEHVYYPNYGYDTTEKDALYYGKTVLISLLIGALVAAIVLYFMRSAMNTAKPQRDAGSYVKSGSYRLNVQQDIFLYSRVTKTRRAENNSGGSSGGGSTVHRSSGGSRHGGRGGRF